MTTTTNSESNVYERSRRMLAIWLLVCVAMIYCMVVIGGVTRLTNSGLSMVEWKPILGVIPPLNQADWKVAFNKYKKYPEYKVRRGMKMGEFKKIYLIEYFHRIFGRLIGLVFAIPFAIFFMLGRLRRSLKWKLLVALLLGGCQGILGWYMVKSGLVNVPHVSHFRLTAHLMLAVFLFTYTLWLALEQLNWKHAPADGNELFSAEQVGQLARLRRWSIGITLVILFMIATGGFVAGKKAGFAFNTWPLMVGQVVPDGLFNMSPWYTNFLENNLTIQFTHRSIAYLLCVLIPVFYGMAIKAKVSGRLRVVLHLFLASLVLQVTLGITTLLYIVPVPLAAAHQGGALVLLSFSVMSVFLLRPFRRKSVESAPAAQALSVPS